MYLDSDAIIRAAEFTAAIGALIGVIISVYKIYAQIKRQEEQINTVMGELSVIVMGLQGALQGLIESGCNGPCKQALSDLENHIREQAHAGGKQK